MSMVSSIWFLKSRGAVTLIRNNAAEQIEIEVTVLLEDFHFADCITDPGITYDHAVVIGRLHQQGLLDHELQRRAGQRLIVQHARVDTVSQRHQQSALLLVHLLLQFGRADSLPIHLGDVLRASAEQQRFDAEQSKRHDDDCDDNLGNRSLEIFADVLEHVWFFTLAES